MEGVIAAKFDRGAWIGEQIRREHLLTDLTQVLERRLTLVFAPAGYGKTSLLAQWRDSLVGSDVTLAWLTLDRAERDLANFVRTLAYAVQQAGEGKDDARLSVDLPPRAALSAIIRELETYSSPFIVVLDDLHYADSQPVCDFLNSLIKMAPPHCHFVFASREIPRLGQSILAAEGQLLEITTKDLKFREEETELLLAQLSESLEPTDIEKILSRTEGWPIAVQLMSISLKRGVTRESVIDHYSESSASLTRYLSDQVLMALPDETREIVIRTALPDRLSGELVNLLCDRQDGWVLLESLEDQGVFLAPVSADRREYRYHQLFAEYLRDRLKRSNQTQYAELQRSVARWYAERGDIADAVNHSILANDHALLAGILVDAGGWRLIPLGMQDVVERGLTALPVDFIRRSPRLGLMNVYLLIKQGELGMARSEFNRLNVEGDLSADLRTDLRVVGDTLADYENQPTDLEDLLSREALLRKLPADDHLGLAHITETLGAKYLEGGWLERALHPTLAARDHYQAFGSVYSELFTRFLEARIKRSQGRAKESGSILDEAYKTIVERFGDRSDLAANCAAFKADLLYEEDRVSEARSLLSWALPHMEQSDGWVDVYAAAYFTEARSLTSEGMLDEAAAIIDRARRIALRRRLQQLELLVQIFEIDQQLLSGVGLETVQRLADKNDLNRLADMMAEESPTYRPVAVAAALCQTRIELQTGQHQRAMERLEPLRRWANQRGAGRLLVDVNILLAYGNKMLNADEQARNCFDEAVGIAMFQDIVRPFVDARHFVRPCLDDAINADAPIDRFREQFLKAMEKSISISRNSVSVLGVFSEAEAEVLHFLKLGHSNKEIARLIGMSPDTVKYRLKSVYKKIGVNTRKDAVRVSAERWNLASPDVRSEQEDSRYGEH
ncbi:MAG: LuxR C-terminal-related transcriptional regulator [Pseudomonadota bacterium]